MTPRRLAVAVNSHLAGALLGRAPGEYRESFDLAAQAGVYEQAMAERLKPSVGMRNVIVHEYVRLDLALVAAAVPEAIDAYRAYVTAVARSLLKGGYREAPVSSWTDEPGEQRVSGTTCVHRDGAPGVIRFRVVGNGSRCPTTQRQRILSSH